MAGKTKSKTEHPHIAYQKTVAGMEPHIVGTSTAVRHVVAQYRHYGTVEGVVSAYPHLTPAQVHDALSYFYDHAAEIEGFVLKNSEEASRDKGIPNVLDRKASS